ncbi:MAG: Holliday junction resolvase RuvX [Elusimicrobiota bacterium]
MPILGLDYGTERIGAAISDPSGLLARELGTIRRENLKKDLEKIKKFIEENKIEKIVLGLPMNMDNTPGKLVGKVKSFAKFLEQEFKIPVDYQDERLTTWQAQKYLQEMGVRYRKGKKKIDRMAARIILQDYLNTKHSC